MNEQNLIISIGEFRKLAGNQASGFSDEEVTSIIEQLDFMAELFIKKTLNNEEEIDSATDENE